MRYDYFEDHFDINNDGELDFMEKSMMKAYILETYHSEEEADEEEDDYGMNREERDFAYMDKEDIEDLYGDDAEDFCDDYDDGDDW